MKKYIALLAVFAIFLTCVSCATVASNQPTKVENEDAGTDEKIPEVEEPEAEQPVSEIEESETEQPVPEVPSSDDVIQYGNTTGNISNNAFAAQDGENVYYLRETDPNSEVITYELVKAPVEGDTESVIFSGDKLSYLNALDGWLYFIGGIDGQVYKVREDGSELSTVSDELTGVNAMVVVNNRIYCRAMDGDRNKTLYSISTDTGEVDTLCQMGQLCSGFAVSDGWIYYSMSENDKWTAYRIRTDGTENEAIGDLNLYSPCIDGDRIYYIDGNQQLRSMGLDGGNNTLLADGISAVRINVSNGWIYYSNTSAIYKIRTDGTDMTKLRDFPSSNNIDINVAGEWIYLHGDGFEDQRISIDENA